jgi:hypothetical protein
MRLNEIENKERKVWHITPASNLPSIMKSGLVPAIGPRSKSINEKKKAIYAFPDGLSLTDAMTNWLDDALGEQHLVVLELIVSENKIYKHPGRWEVQMPDIDEWYGEYPGSPPEEWHGDAGDGTWMDTD